MTTRVIAPGDVVFANADAPARLDLACPVCATRGPALPVLTVPAIVAPHAVLNLFRCGACESVYFEPSGVRDFSDLDQESDDSWRHYVESGAGVWDMIWPIVVGRERGSLLDVGCGFGFAVDFWRHTGRGEAVGLESAAYGRLGATMLGIPVFAERLGESTRLEGCRFDVVYASEVIEHVADPRAFAAMLAHYVADDGMLVLTTPAASYVDPANAGPSLLAALSPGFHGFLLSGRAFEDALRAAGFPHVEVRVTGERQFAWASRLPFVVAPDPEAFRPSLRAYLGERASDVALDFSVRVGHLFRLLRDLLRAGRMDEASVVARELGSAMAGKFGESVLDPDATLPRFASCATPKAIGAVGPYFLPTYYQFAAVIAQHVRRDAAEARRLYRGAALTTLACARVGSAWYMEAIASLWKVRIDGALLGLAMGDERDADVLALVADEGTTPSARHLHATVDVSLVDRLLPPVAEQLAARKMWSAARTLAAAYRRHVARHYDPSLADAGRVDEALRDPDARLPVEPLFLPWFDALDDLRSATNAPRGRDTAQRLVRIAETHVAHPRLGRALAAFAHRVRDRAGLGSGDAKVVFEAVYKIDSRR